MRARLCWRHAVAAGVMALAVWAPATTAAATTNPTLPSSVVPAHAAKAAKPAGEGAGVRTPAAGSGVSALTVTTPLGPTRTTARGGARAKGATGSGAATTLPAVEGYVGGSNVSIGDMWSGGSLQAATSIQIPVTFAGLLVVFVLVQWLIDHRDPRFVEAPARREDDSIGFD